MNALQHGGQLEAVARQYGLVAETILDLSANINPDGPPESVLRALRAGVDDTACLTRYPDLELSRLRAAIATHVHTSAEAVAVANGFVPLLEAVLRLRKVTRCLLPVPAFSEYRRTLERCGVEVVPYALQPHGFRYQAGSLLAAMARGGCDALLLANPQNPSGWLTSGAEILGLVDSLPGATLPGALVLLDEAFIDYAPEASITEHAAANEQLVVFRSLTKFFAMPALRVAYAVGGPRTIEGLRDWLPPWPVSTLAARGAEAALADRAYAERACEGNVRRRQSLEQGLARLGIRCHAAAANFLLLRLEGDAPAVWERLLRERGVLLRLCSNFEALSGEHLRTAVGSVADCQRLLEALAWCYK